MEQQEFAKATIIGHGADSIVFSLGENEKVLKLYNNLHIHTLRRYHQIQHDAAKRVQDELGGKIVFSGKIAGRVVRSINLRILPLTQEMIVPLSEELTDCVKRLGCSICAGATASCVPYIGGSSLNSYKEKPGVIKDIVDVLDDELSHLGIPVGGANGYNGIHPVNIKVFSESNSDRISLVITDIGASINGVVALANNI